MSKKRKKQHQVTKTTKKTSYRNTVIFIICLVLATVAVIWYMGYAKEQKQKEFNQQMLESARRQREPIKDDWMKAAELVASRSQNAQAKEVMNFLTKNLGLARPYPNGGIQLLDVPDGAQYKAFFCPILPSDLLSKMGEIWQRWNSMSSGGMTDYENGIITVGMGDSLGQITKGIILLHEGNHLRQSQLFPFNHHDNAKYTEEEIRVYKTQHEILAAVGGELYEQLLVKEMDRIGKYLTDSNVVLEDKVPFLRHEYYTELNAIFGPSKSLYERDALQTFLYTNGVMKYIETRYVGDKEAMAHSFIYSFYVHADLLKQ